MSLQDCFSKAGKALSSQDRTAIEALVADGVSEMDAVQQHLTALNGELQGIADTVEASGGAVARDAVEQAPVLRQAINPQRNNIGMYQSVEKIVLEMNIPGWKPSKKNPEGKANGTDIWAKIKSTGKPKELKWLGVEEFLTLATSSKQELPLKFTRENVLDFIHQNGVQIEETVADGQNTEGGSFNWDETIDDDSANWDGRADDYMYDYDRANTLEELADDLHFTTVEDLEEMINHRLDNSADFEIPDAVLEAQEKLRQLDNISPDQLPLEGIEVRDIGEERAQATEAITKAMLAEIRDAVYELAHTAAEEEYMENPVRVYEDSDTGITITGNDDLGYYVSSASRGTFESEVYSFNEAEISATEYAYDQGLFEGDNADENVAQWGDESYNMGGDYDKYRVLKLKLPDIEGDFYNDVHFPDRNIVAFLRVDDRNLWAESKEAVSARQPEIDMTGITAETAEGFKPHDGRAVYDLFRSNGVKIDRMTATSPEDAIARWADSQKQDAFFSNKMDTYFIDEFQSDWHTAGRNFGYVTAEELPNVADLKYATKQRLNELNDSFTLSEEMQALFYPGRGTMFTVTEYVADKEGAKSNTLTSSAVKQYIKDVEAELRKTEEGIAVITAATDFIRFHHAIPDAPFAGDDWIALGLKRALVDAVEQGYDSIGWVNAATVADRWSSSYDYTAQYDLKMVNVVKKLSKHPVAHLDMGGNAILTEKEYAAQHKVVETVDDSGDMAWVIEKNGERVPFNGSDVFYDSDQAQEWIDETARESTGEAGYHILQITEELRDIIKAESFPLFQNLDSSTTRGYYDPVNSLIRLTESANMSTFLHEFGHFIYETERKVGSKTLKDINAWYLRTADAIAVEAGTTEEQVRQYVKYDTTGDLAVDAKIRTAVHENFARALEQYVMEGKAPSVELRNVFRTIARWIVDVYNQVKEGLQHNLDDEMRQVFDRMFATEEQIQVAEATAQLRPMFTDAAMAGMTEEQYAAYLENQQKSSDKAAETLRNKLIRQYSREAERWWRHEKSVVEDDEREKTKEERVYKARETLTTPLADATDNTEQMAALEKQRAKLIKDNDTIGKFISKKGGLNREAMEAEGIDPAHFKERGKVFGKPLFPKEKGMTSDDLAEKLSEAGFGDVSANDAMDIINDMLSGDETFVDLEVNAELDHIDNELSHLQEESDAPRGLKLDRATVKKLVGKTVTNKQGTEFVEMPPQLKSMTITGGEGVHPDDAAAFLGYASGAEMLDDIINAPSLTKAVEERAEAIMKERHGDIMTDGTIQQLADDALRNEERSAMLFKELKSLSKGTSQQVITRQATQDIAERLIGQRSYRDLQPGKYRKAELRAAQESAVAFASGDTEVAARAKARQMMNFYLGKAAQEARDQTLKIVDHTARYRSKPTRDVINKAGGGFMEQIDKLLSRFEFRKSATLKSVDKANESIKQWADDRIEHHGDALVLTPLVLDEGYIDHWKNVPFAELKGVSDSLKNIEHVARYANKINVLDEKFEFNKLIRKMVDHIRGQNKAEHGQAQRIHQKNRVGWAASQMSKIPWMVRELDGGEAVGFIHDVMMQPFNDANHEELTMMDATLKDIYHLITGRSKEDRARHNSTLFIPEIKDSRNDGKLKGHQVLAVALNTGNQGNLRKLLLGEGWANPENDAEITIDNPQLQAVLRHMTKSDWEMVQLIWDRMETLYPALSEIHRRTTGLTPPKVEATPITNEHGTFAGGYYPVKYDRNRSRKARENEDRANAAVDSMFSAGGTSIQASVSAGATNERTGFYDPIKLSLEVVPEHFQETIHYITHHDAVRQTNKIIRNPEFEAAVVAVIGQNEFDQLKPWLNDVAKAGKNSPNKTFIDASFNQLRMGVTLGIMGFKASTGIIQMLGATQTFSELGTKNTYRGYKITIRNSALMRAFRGLLGSQESLQSGMDFAIERSKVMAHRIKTMDREMASAFRHIESSTGLKSDTGKKMDIPVNAILSLQNSKALKKVQEVSMMHIALIQMYTVDLPSWHAAYDTGLREWGDEGRAAKYADFTVENLQGSGATKDLPTLMRNQSKIHTSFTMFMTFFSTFWNINRGFARDVKKGRATPVGIAAKMAFLYFIPTLLEMLMRDDLIRDDEDDEDRLQRYLLQTALYPVQSVPFVRDIVHGVTGDYGYTLNPVAGVLEKGVEGFSGIFNAAFDEDKEVTQYQLKGASKLVASVLGVPGINQLWTTGEHLQEVLEEGEEATTHQLLFGPKR